VLSLERMAAGIIPAVDVLASHSGLIENHELSDRAVAIANGVRHALAVAAAVDSKLAQPMRIAEAYTGSPGVQVSPEQARAELAAQL
jgi:F0F1-type ATP synthase beta subunit